MEALGVDVELFDAADHCRLDDLGERGANFREAQPVLAAALGAAALPRERQNLLSRQEATAADVRRYSIAGAGIAGLLLLALVAWGLFAMLMATWRGTRVDGLQREVATLNQQVASATATATARAEHRRRRALLEHQAQESGIVGALLQRLGRQVPDQMVFETIEWTRSLGVEGEPYWTAQVDGLVFGETRTESQAIFSRFFSLMASEPIVHDVRLVEPLVVGSEDARVPNPMTTAIQETFSRRQQAAGGGSSDVRGAEEGRPVIGAELFEDNPSGIQETPLVTVTRTSVDDLPPFEPTSTSVGFKMAIDLLTVPTGGSQ
jgi:Tfp pilus assembly protein PilN